MIEAAGRAGVAVVVDNCLRVSRILDLRTLTLREPTTGALDSSVGHHSVLIQAMADQRSWMFTDLDTMTTRNVVADVSTSRTSMTLAGGLGQFARGLTTGWVKVGDRFVAPLTTEHPTTSPIWTTIGPDETIDIGRPIPGCQARTVANVVPAPGVILVECRISP